MGLLEGWQESWLAFGTAPDTLLLLIDNITFLITEARGQLEPGKLSAVCDLGQRSVHLTLESNEACCLVL